MLGQEGMLKVGNVEVATTSHVGLSVEHWTERCLEKIVYVAKNSNSVIREQAEAFKDSIRLVINYFMKQAVKSDRTTLYNVLLKAGHTEAAELIRRL